MAKSMSSSKKPMVVENISKIEIDDDGEDVKIIKRTL